MMLLPAVVIALHVAAAGPSSEPAVLNLHAVSAAGATAGAPLEITLFRWPTDAERAALLAALSTPTPPPDAPAPPPAGRGGRGGRGAAPPMSPMARLEAAVNAASTCGYIWGDGVTGYSIKYAWRASSPGGDVRIVLVTARKLGANVGSPEPTPASAADRDFTVIEMHLDPKGSGDARASYARVAVDAAAKTLALDDYAAAPTLFKVIR